MVTHLLVAILFALPYLAEFEIFESSVGCFKDDTNNPKLAYEVQNSNSSKTVELCIDACLKKYYMYAGLHNAHNCFCGSSYGAFNQGICNAPCIGNVSQMCGGKNSTSIYDTGQQIPGPPAWIKLLNVTETSLQVEWAQPDAPNGPIDKYIVTANYETTYSTNSFLPPLTLTYLNSTTKADLLNLHAGTRYTVSVAAYSKHKTGVLQSDLYWTSIGEPTAPSAPVVVKHDKGKIFVRLTPSTNENGPVTAYRVAVIHEEGLASFQPELLKSYSESQIGGLAFYIAAEILPEDLSDVFVVGDDKVYGKYHNPPIPVDEQVHVSLGLVSTLNGITKVTYAETSHEQHGIMVLNVNNVAPGNSSLVVGLSVAIGVFGFLLLLSMVTYFVLRQRLGHRRHIPDHQELSLECSMIDVETNSFVHNGYVPEEETERVDHYENLKQKLWNMPRNFLDVKMDVLGHGQYGSVVKGTVQQRGFPVPVAVHIIADGELSVANKKSMLQDLDLLIRSSSFVNVVNLVGTCENPDTLYVVIEHHPATLKDVLLESRCMEHLTQTRQRFCSLAESQVLETAMGVARAMDYLDRNNIVHKKLAARNVMMADGIVPKVTGFGLAQYNKGDVIADYTRWTAQEIFRSRHYVSKCDVWSFGCLLWEITALGGTPYVDVNSGDVPARVMRGLRLPQLHMVGDDLYQLMLQCWQLDLDERPTFQNIIHIMENLLEDSEMHVNFAVYTGFHYEQYAPNLEQHC